MSGLLIAMIATLANAQTYSARTDVAAQAYPATIPCPYNGVGCTVGNGSLTGAGYSFTPSDFATPIVRLTDKTMGSTQHQFNTSCDASSEVNDFNVNKDRVALCEAGNNQRVFGMNTTTYALTYDASFPSPGIGSIYWSYTSPYTAYHAHKNGSNDLAIFSYDFTCAGGIATCNPTPVQVVDLGTACSLGVLTGNTSATVTEGLTVSGDDQTFGVLGSTTQSQGAAGAQYAIAWNRTNGCTYWNTGTGHVFVNGVDQGALAITDTFYMHNMRLAKSGAWMKVSMQSGTCQSTCSANWNYFWQIASPKTVNVSLQTSNGCGHTAVGYSHFVNKCATGHNANDLLETSFTSVNTNTSLPVAFPSPVTSNGAHISWANDNASDANPFISIMEASAFAAVNGWDNELLGVATDGSGKVYRFAHTYATPTESPFVPGSISQDGTLLMWTSDWDGMLGNVSNSSAVCDPVSAVNCRSDVFLAVLPIQAPSVAPVAQGGDWNNVTASPPPPVWPPTDSNGQTLASTLFRLWDSGMKWSQIESANGVFTWTKLDEVVNGLVPNPLMKVVYTFGSTPKWASACSAFADPSTCLPGPTGSGFGGGTQCSSPTDYSCTPTSDVATDGTGTDAFFQNFVLALVNRYPNKIAYYEGWNEADSPNFWCQAPSPTACGGGNSSTTANTAALKRLVRMLWDAKQIVHCKSPSSLMISPAGHVGSMPTWFNKFATTTVNAPAGSIGGCSWAAATVSGKQTFDITNEHMRGTSSTNSDPTAVIAAYNAAVTEINHDGLPTALMNTEFGYNGTAQAANPDIQAAYVGINYILQNSFSGTSIPILAGIWYQIDSPQGPLQGTIAGLAYNTVAGWFNGGTESACTVSGTIYTCPGTNALSQSTLYAWDMGQNCNSGCTTANHAFGAQYTSYATLDGLTHFTTGGNGTAPLGYKPIRLTASAAVKTLAVNGGNNQSGTVSTILPVALTVLATSNSVAQSGVSVAFSDGGVGGVFTPATATTNGSGIASTTYTLPSSAQTVTVTATATGYSSTTFTETATAATQVLTLSGSSGNNQAGNLSTLLPIPLGVIATINGAPTSGVTVTYSDGGAGGSFGTPNPTTNNAGQASSTYTLPNSAQTVTVTVSSSGYTSAIFTETAAALVVSPQSGNNQTGTVGMALPVALQAQVTSNGTAVSGVTVNFSDGGAGGVFSVTSGVSNSFGNVSTVYTLPATPQTITITASATGYTSGTFTEHSVVDILSPIAGNAQGGPNGTTLPVPLTVLATINGVPASGITVLFTDNSAGGSFGTPAGITGSNGTITTTYTLPNSAQSITINASAGGYTSATFTETSFTPNPPAGVAVTPGVNTNNAHIN